jgi:hypothetical protein
MSLVVCDYEYPDHLDTAAAAASSVLKFDSVLIVRALPLD